MLIWPIYILYTHDHIIQLIITFYFQFQKPSTSNRTSKGNIKFPTSSQNKMGYWLSENATEAYLKSMKMGNEPDVAEFVKYMDKH